LGFRVQLEDNWLTLPVNNCDSRPLHLIHFKLFDWADWINFKRESLWDLTLLN
jgi:hypothetical protein